jgi:hypothetical protein
MRLEEALTEVWRQVLVESRSSVELDGQSFPVTRTRNQRSRPVHFEVDHVRFFGIEQSPNRTSRWAQLAKKGERIMQFSYHGRYVANVREGKLLRHSAGRRADLLE